MKTTGLLIAACLLTFHTFSQLKQKMADDLFARLEYYKCVEIYEEMADKVVKDLAQTASMQLINDQQNIQNIRRAAIVNYKLVRMQKAIHYFTCLEKQGKLEEHDREYYIQALRFIGNNKQAERIIDESHKLHPENTYFSELKSELKDFNSLFLDSADIVIKKTKISSAYGDFSPVFYRDGLVYATKSKSTTAINSRYKWDNSYFINLMYSKFEPDSSIKNGKLLKHHFLDNAHDGPVSFTPDQQTMVITKNKRGVEKDKNVIVLALYFSEFVDGKWTDLVPFEYNNDAYNVGHGCFSDDGKTLFFVSDMPGGYGQTDIYRSRYVEGRWLKPQNLGNTYNTSMQEMFPFVIGEKLYFSSNGHFGLGGLDLFEVDLSKDGTPGGKPRNMKSPINSAADDFALICNKEGSKGYFSSNRSNAVDAIYAFEREDPQIELVVHLYEKYDVSEALSNHPILLKNLNTHEQTELLTDADGKIHAVIRKNENYQLFAQKQYFNLSQEVAVSSQGIRRDTVIKSELYLLPTKITIALRVIAKDSRQPLEEVNTLVYHTADQTDTLLFTNADGVVYMTVDREKDFRVFASKKGYLDAEINANTATEDGKVFEMELELVPIKKGDKFVVDDIFYDYNQASLRSESTDALDRLANFILENDIAVELSSHTDSRGSNSYNQKLSQARAQSCVDYLISKGVRKSQMKAKGYGESQLVNRCTDGVQCSEEEHQLNRRTEVKILEY